MDKVVEVTGATLHFGHVVALEDVNLDLHAGEIVALLGDNGAGKSTLMNVMSGALSLSHGDVKVRGEPVLSLKDAQRLGIGVVYQDLALCPHLPVAENMFLGREALQGGYASSLKWLDRRRMNEMATAEIERLGISTLRDIRASVGDLSGGQRQVVAIARAIMWTKTAILLDEPTAALGPKQVEIVLESIRAVAARGIAVCIVAHDIPHILQVADRLAILRRGRMAKTLSAAGRTVTEVVAYMVGEE